MASFLILNPFSFSVSQVVEDGYEFFAKRQLVTLFSAPNYCGEFDNAGAMMSVDETLMCSFQVSSTTHECLWPLLQMVHCSVFVLSRKLEHICNRMPSLIFIITYESICVHPFDLALGSLLTVT